ncbi:MAG: LytTR family transcriptional regulator DNA-binding domain-containing protein [Flavobacteriales bacterium]|nr:LytTR family transcriptional regulator DNA-binding domain-containing protein [Flavobacteriales bacterium]
MGSNGQGSGRNVPLQFIGHDGNYTLWPDDIIYLSLQPIAASTARPSGGKRKTMHLVVCFMCRQTKAPVLVTTRLRSMTAFAFLTDMGFFQIHRQHIVNLSHVQRYALERRVYFTHTVMHAMILSKHNVKEFKEAIGKFCTR